MVSPEISTDLPNILPMAASDAVSLAVSFASTQLAVGGLTNMYVGGDDVAHSRSPQQLLSHASRRRAADPRVRTIDREPEQQAAPHSQRDWNLANFRNSRNQVAVVRSREA